MPSDLITRPDPALRARAFAAAKRHSRKVRFYRIALPVLAVIGSIAIFMFIGLGNDPKLAFSVDNVGIGADGLTMDNARLTGFDDINLYCEVIADTATQTLNNAALLNLEGITAQISGEDDSWANLDAATGIYDRDNELLNLRTNIHVRSSEGYDVYLETADVDLAAGRVETTDPVRIDLLNGTVNARAMTIEDRGETLRFYNGVTLQFVPNQQGQPATENRNE